MADSKVKIYVNGQSLDLFDNETIVINRSIKDVQDITKVLSDYTNTFEVPASPINNAIFQHYYNPAIINGYDNNERAPSLITLDGFLFKSGGITINAIKMEYNKAVSYSITFYSKLSDIKEIIGDDTLQDLDLSIYNHTYDITTIALGLTQGLYSEDIIYPMFSNYSNWTNSDPALTSGRYPWSVCLNPADPSRPSWSGIRFNHLKPAISYPAIIGAIETKYGLTFSGSFFTSSNADDTSLVNDIYMWTNHYKETIGDAKLGIPIGFLAYFRGNADAYSPQFGTFPNGTTYTKTTTNPVIGLSASITYSDLTDTITANILVDGDVVGSAVMPSTSVSNTVTFSGATMSTIDVSSIGQTIQLELVSINKSLTFNIENWQVDRLNSLVTTLFKKKSNGILTQYADVNMSIEIPPIKTIDFINSLINMFNLVVDSEDGFTFTFDKFRKYFNETAVDISDYIVYNKYELKPVDSFNSISFNYLPNIANTPNLFTNTYGRDFGDLTASLPSKSVNKLEINAPFALPITEKLFNINTNVYEDVPILKNFKGVETGAIVLSGVTFSYSPISETEASDNSMLFYKNNNIDISSYNIGMTDAPYGTQSNDYTNIQLSNMFECLAVRNFTDGTYSRYFNLSYSGDNEQYYGNIIYGTASGYMSGSINVVNQTMFDQNWFDYIGDIFDNRTKLYSFDAILPVSITNVINLNNVIVINSRRFRINKLQINLTSGVSKFELINII